MLNRTLQLLLAGCLMSGSLWAADNPFVGKWKVNPSKSILNDEMQVEAAGANRYTFTFGPGQVDTIVADGSDQPALSGTTLSVTVKRPNSWDVTRKLKGRTLLTAQWTLSADGKTLNDAFTQPLPNGSIGPRSRMRCEDRGHEVASRSVHSQGTKLAESNAE
jgi:hypothetical protein